MEDGAPEKADMVAATEMVDGIIMMVAGIVVDGTEAEAGDGIIITDGITIMDGTTTTDGTITEVDGAEVTETVDGTEETEEEDGENQVAMDMVVMVDGENLAAVEEEVHYFAFSSLQMVILFDEGKGHESGVWGWDSNNNWNNNWDSNNWDNNHWDNNDWHNNNDWQNNNNWSNNNGWNNNNHPQ